MSAPLRLNADLLRDLADALDGLTAVRESTGVVLDLYGALDLGVGASSVRVAWDAEDEGYVIDDLNGA